LAADKLTIEFQQPCLW